jgi:hypothetical protein
MKLSELLTDLNTRPESAQVLVVELDLVNDVGPILIESIAGGNEKSVILMGKAVKKNPVHEFLSRMVEDTERGKPTKVFNTSIRKSERDGKYEVTIDGKTIQSAIDTAQEAKQFARGFVLGFEMGSSGNGLNAADQSGS